MSQQLSLVKTSKISGIQVILMDRSPVNALSKSLREAVSQAFDEALSDGSIKGIVISSGKDLPFSAGADITEFSSPDKLEVSSKDNWFTVLSERLKSSSKPIVAAIQKYALGGGLELSLACDARVGVGSLRLGLPEVTIGVLPGGGGTQLLPRLIGIEAAISMICSGQPVNGQKALEMGLLDAYDADATDVVSYACKWLLHHISQGTLRKRRSDFRPKALDESSLTEMRKTIIKQSRGRQASVEAFDCVMKSTSLDLVEGFEFEWQSFLTLVSGEQSQAMRYVFFAERMASHVPGVPLVKDDGIATIGIVGGGTMGGGIAMSCVQQQLPVTLVEVNQNQIDHVAEIIRMNFQSSAKKGKFTQDQINRWQSMITYTTDVSDLHQADCIIEAVFENMAVKKEIFAKLDAIAKPGCILATNTSGLDINEIASVTSRPEHVLGLHFFSPANIMKLLEVVNAKKTDKSILGKAISFAKRIKKIPVTVGVCPDFVGNRMLAKYLEQAIWMLSHGVSHHQVDAIVYAFGMPMGPFVMSDMVGLDLAVKRDPEGDSIVHALCAAGRNGLKGGAGFYDYKSNSRVPEDADKANQIIKSWVDKQKVVHSIDMSDEDIKERCLYALINEAVNILHEGIALRGSDVDVIYVYGYGWPPYYGGPMWYADQIGLENVYECIKKFKAQDLKAGRDLWHISPLWQTLIDGNKKLSTYQSR